MTRDSHKFGSGHDDGLEPLQALDVAAADSVDALVRAMSQTAFGGRNLGEAADVLEAMVTDPECFKVVTVSGAMTIAKQGLVLCEMIDRGWVDAIVSTGALMTHGLVEGAGMSHFKHRPDMRDEQLFVKGYNRVYDTIELEQNLDDTDELMRAALADHDPAETLSSHRIMQILGAHLSGLTEGRAILKSAHARGVPIYVPAFTDSELGLDVAILNRLRVSQGRPRIPFDPFLDLEDFAARIVGQERIGIFTIGGGVPRNWAQQVSPFLDIVNLRLGTDHPVPRYRYALRICPEPVHWGGLSGCTYSEGVSWGKFLPRNEGGRHAEVYADATIAWPILVRAVIERTSAATRAHTGAPA